MYLHTAGVDGTYTVNCIRNVLFDMSPSSRVLGECGLSCPSSRVRLGFPSSGDLVTYSPDSDGRTKKLWPDLVGLQIGKRRAAGYIPSLDPSNLGPPILPRVAAVAVESVAASIL